MRIYSIDELKKVFAEKGYMWPKFHLIGIRSNSDKADRFDDVIYVVDNDKMYAYKCTTNPGVYWLQKFANPKGSAVLKQGQYPNAWAIGLHQGKYEALVQVRPITVFRDADKDNKAEEQGVEDIGLFGINIHRADKSLATYIIGQWSAGCQVIADPDDFDELLSKCKQSGLNQFTYTLVKEF